ncbi:MAG TPA: polysaccharide biosynthesis C-terminal domain-containing protein, partial [Candidatus Scatosoma pullistercoris]|nr:polysaccharide biosynthesis C-terminal domain-containing protein [Candidatus Scatosoma pullistercoris]
MQIQKHAIDLGNDSVGKLVVRLAVPAVIAQLINLLYNLVDRMYVGAIKDIGMEALAGLGVVFPITLIVSAFANLVGLGGAPLAGIFLGEKRRDKANEVFNAGIVMLAFFSVVLTALVLIFCEPLVRLFGAPANVSGYARDYLFVYGAGTVFVMVSLGLNPFITTQGYSLTSMLTVTIGAGLNIALDPLFIFVFGLGVRGAALATILSQAVSAVWVILFFSGKRSLFRFDFRLFRPKSAV